MRRVGDVLRAKSKISVGVEKADGSVLEGFVYLEGDQRVLDLLNNHERFFPLEVEGDRLLLLSKNAIVHVEPFDKEWMATPVE